MVKQLEVTLYRSAPSFEAYIDKSTLKERLQSIATEISNDAKHIKNQNRGSGHGSSGMQSLGPTSVGDPMNPQGNGGLAGPSSMGPMHGGPMPPGQYPPHGYGHGPPPQSQMPPQSMSSSSIRGGGGKDIVNLGNVNKDMMGLNSSNDNGISSSSSLNNGMYNMSGTGSLTEGKSVSMNSNENYNRDHKERLRKQQQRLLLLHHSSKCQAPEGKCTKTPYCKEMKRLWLHMAKCEDYNCRVHHCYSSRTILSHYRKCKDQECEICKPVRLSVWRSKAERMASEQIPNSDLAIGRENVPPPPAPQYTSTQVPYMSQPNNGSPPGPLPPQPNSYPSQQSYQPSQKSAVPMPPPNYRPDSQNSGAISSTEAPLDPAENAEWKKRIAHKQQRLLLLRHASKCTAPEGNCEVTPHCHNMKLLWHHISKCSKKDCEEPHCISSRYVLMHYRKCKDVTCPSCQPVREAIRKGNESKAKLAKDASRKRPLDDSQQVPQTVSNPPSSSSPIQKRQRQVEKKVDDSTSTLLKSLTVEQIELHIQSLSQVTNLAPKVLKDKCLGLLTMLRNHDDGWVFNAPVDPVALGLPDYFERIKNPMDLGTINKRLDSGSYRDIKGFDSDIRLTFDNVCFTTNQIRLFMKWQKD
jgi:Transcription factor involved in chromatin remodeling, contains bromodomain